jgi:hypothetical protein
MSSLDEQFKELVLARLQTLPPDASISIGSTGEFDKTQLLQHVEDGDDIGQKIIEIYKEYLQALKDNSIFA